MQKGRPSDTAWQAAVLRAVHAVMDQPPILNDYLAGQLCGLNDASAIVDAVNALESKWAKYGTLELAKASMRATRVGVVVRTRWAEDGLLQAVADRDISQYVVLGAGFDTFAHRRPNLPRRLQLFEVDHPDTQTLKRTRLRALGMEPPPYLTYVPLDFESAPILATLEEHGYRRQEPAYFSWLGVTMYLSPDSVRRTLQDIAATAAGSEVALNYVVPPSLLGEEDRRVQRLLESSIAEGGEPRRTYFEPAEIVTLLRELGFAHVSQLSPEAATAHYLPNRVDGLRVSGLTNLLRAEL